MIRRKSVTGLAALAVVATSLVQFVGTQVAHASGNTTYTPGTVNLATVENGPWTLSQGDPAFGAPYNESLPTFTPGGTPTQTGGYPNLAVYPAATAPPGPPVRHRGGGHARTGRRLLHQRWGTARDGHPGRRAGEHGAAHVAVLLPLRDADAR